MISCNKCYGNEIEELVWVDTVTGEITDRRDEYYCRNCGATVDIIITPDNEWIEDITPLED